MTQKTSDTRPHPKANGTLRRASDLALATHTMNHIAPAMMAGCVFSEAQMHTRRYRR